MSKLEIFFALEMHGTIFRKISFEESMSQLVALLKEHNNDSEKACKALREAIADEMRKAN